MSTPVKRVAVVGGSGLTGGEITRALLQSGFEVTVLSRASSSNSKIPDGARSVKTDYSRESLAAAFQGQDAVVSAITTFFVGQQFTIIDAAIEAGVRRFIPSEYGVDTSDPAIAEIAPPAGTKNEIVAYLQSKQATISWSAIIVGAFFDAILEVPGALGLNLAENTMTIFDGGDVEFEATNVDQIGRAVAAVLSPEHFDSTANQYVYVNSFTLTQNQMLHILQDLTGNKLEVKHAKKADMRKDSQEKIKSDPDKGDVWARGSFEGIILIMLNEGGFCEYSNKGRLWNKRLGLPEGNVEATIKAVLSKKE
ncbi:hypothetical protein H2204_005501 [Knufia peltigerae]|uniref:Semialdehyde dehydrogenase NAD-binding domain-containing protein n=1 Tax=Knufia peltigerae TaxID=1002370 RepID=A0AA39CZS8_9EURO|nr:hypothetical protein H2204_005501 [Knufia peltigerae]